MRNYISLVFTYQICLINGISTQKTSVWVIANAVVICNAIVATIDELFLTICKFRKILLDCKQKNKKIIKLE